MSGQRETAQETRKWIIAIAQERRAKCCAERLINYLLSQVLGFVITLPTMFPVTTLCTDGYLNGLRSTLTSHSYNSRAGSDVQGLRDGVLFISIRNMKIFVMKSEAKKCRPPTEQHPWTTRLCNNLSNMNLVAARNQRMQLKFLLFDFSSLFATPFPWMSCKLHKKDH